LSAKFSDEEVISAWQDNAVAWTESVREKKIESRRLVTDAAIVDAVMSRQPQTVLDIGCGEGWLARALTEKGVRCVGVDVVPDLIEKARAFGGGDFRVASYESMIEGSLDAKFDVAVANFSLIGSEAVDALIAKVPSMLNAGGALIIQTPHPVIAGGDLPYRDGWREGSWAGCGDNFSKAAPWYFRTVETWVKLLSDSGLHLAELREPIHPVYNKPASLILIGESPQ
jgi:2-polyprenyl-3-methyl-5-hydroxy-6-metoxy-1,4-benzoquinol methylase